MDVQSCLIKLGYKAVVWGNSYEGIKPHELETRPIPTLTELNEVWPQFEAERIATEKIEKETIEIEFLIQSKIRELAIVALIIDKKLTIEGKLISKVENIIKEEIL